ncbi:transcription initiation factor TFIID subunit 4 [Oryx dammah]|uniref:transcription initiation factor TFIID subunit 4 n=1 Tax=Oryx dammah TaxID=59534 RepID=UPI001A9B339B|nr:transcription initiation factor TFIID subunit 4 [Oryx dammah]
MMPALGKGGPLPRPSCLRGACSSRRAGRLGQESGCGGRKRGVGGVRKFCPRGWSERECPPPAKCLDTGDSTAQAADECSPAPRPHLLLLRLSCREVSSGAFFLVSRNQAGSSGPGAGEGARVAGGFPGGPGEELAAARRFSPSAEVGRPFRWRRLGVHGRECSRRGHCFQDAREPRREGVHASRLLPPTPAPPPTRPPVPGLAGGSGGPPAAGGAHVGCRALARRLGPGRIPFPASARLECGVVIVKTLRSGGAARRSRSRCGSRCPGLGRAGCRPGGALTSPPRSAPVLPPPAPPLPFTLPPWSPLVARKSACAAGRPDSSQLAPPPRLRPPLPPGLVCERARARVCVCACVCVCVCVRVCIQQLRPGELMLEVQRWSGEGGLEIKTDDDLSFPRLAFPSLKRFSKPRASLPIPLPTPSPPHPGGSEFKCVLSQDFFRCEFHNI